jgi:hypothetical protein
MNSSLGGSSFGVDSLEGSLGRSLGVAKGSHGGQGNNGSRFSGIPPVQNPFQQKILGGIKHGEEVRFRSNVSSNNACSQRRIRLLQHIDKLVLYPPLCIPHPWNP